MKSGTMKCSSSAILLRRSGFVWSGAAVLKAVAAKAAVALAAATSVALFRRSLRFMEALLRKEHQWGGEGAQQIRRQFRGGEAEPNVLASRGALDQPSRISSHRDQPCADRALFVAGAELHLFSGRSICGDSIVPGDYAERGPGAAQADGAQRCDNVLHCADQFCRRRATDLQTVWDHAAGL